MAPKIILSTIRAPTAVRPRPRRVKENILSQHRLECGAISTSGCHKSIDVCQQDIISTKLDTLDGDHRPLNLRRSCKNCLPRCNFDAISMSRYNTLKLRSRQSITQRKNIVRQYTILQLNNDLHIHVRIATQKCKVDCPLLEYSGYVLEYARRVGGLYNEFSHKPATPSPTFG